MSARHHEAEAFLFLFTVSACKRVCLELTLVRVQLVVSRPAPRSVRLIRLVTGERQFSYSFEQSELMLLHGTWNLKEHITGSVLVSVFPAAFEQRNSVCVCRRQQPAVRLTTYCVLALTGCALQ